MDTLRLETLSQRPLDKDQKARQQAERTAEQFESIFVRTMVQSLRQSATLGGEGGMFGSGAGSDTYTDWFDQNLAERLGAEGGIGIKATLLRDMERRGDLKPLTGKAGAEPATVKQLDLRQQAAQQALAAADRAALHAVNRLGGIDVQP